MIPSRCAGAGILPNLDSDSFLHSSLFAAALPPTDVEESQSM